MYISQPTGGRYLSVIWKGSRREYFYSFSIFLVLNPMLPSLWPTPLRGGLYVGHVMIAPYVPKKGQRIVPMYDLLLAHVD
jgi:hypothetical protein